MDIKYVGEALIYGKMGNLFIALAFAGALLAAVAWYFSFRRREEERAWKSIARYAFLVHSLAVVAIFALLYYLIFNHRYEYYYVWQHSNTLMPAEYIFASFWEGQEGSFLLWSFWHVVLSWFIILRKDSWEGPVMVSVSLVQAFLISMVLGITVFGHKIGMNPFILLREHPDMAGLPFLQFPDYLQRIEDGRGLNPLLQNYWMVIHPPVLFLGFAATVLPFAFAMGGLMTGRVTEWTREASPWAFFGVMSLGAGILMGAAWAYEALSFGGFWAWDPVENASLVPWLTLVGAAHVMLVNQKNGTTAISSLLLSVVTFLLVLYSTFLTRSGILGDTSVHSFTDLGMTGHLVVYMAFFALMAVVLIWINRKNFPKSNTEDNLFSREFWIFIGMLVLVISGIQITFTTSIPVINKIFGTNMAPPTDVIEHYNSWQVPFAIIISLLIGFSHYLKFKETPRREFFIKLLVPFVASMILTALIYYFYPFTKIHYLLLLFASVFAVAGSVDYGIRFLKGKFDRMGGSIAHLGIGLILLGALISNGQSKVISKNILNVDLGDEFANNENIMLIKGDTLRMDRYFVAYTGQEKKGVKVYYNIEYFEADFENNRLKRAFTLNPMVQLNPRMGNVAEPATKRFLSMDLYTHVTYADLEKFEKPAQPGDFMDPVEHEVAKGDTFTTTNALIVFEGFTQPADKSVFGLGDSDMVVGAQLRVTDINMKSYTMTPMFIIKNNVIMPKEEVNEALGFRLTFDKINTENGKAVFTLIEKKENKRDFIIMKAIVFPQINILWTGCILLVLGSMMTIRKRFRKLAQQKRENLSTTV